MLEFAKYWVAASYFVAIGLAVEQLRRPLSTWKAAGRERRFWVSMTLVTGFHGLGQFAAVAYLTAVVPRFRAGGAAALPAGTAISASPDRPAQPKLLRWGSAVALRRGERTAAESLALVAALLVFASSFVHGAVIADHMEYWVPFGICFVIVTCAQAAWTALIYRKPGNRRVLAACAAGNLALVAVWTVSRVVGLPVGPQPWKPEPVGVADVLCTLDELVAAVLIAVVLAASQRAKITGLYVRLASSLAGPLFIWSILMAFGAKHTH